MSNKLGDLPLGELRRMLAVNERVDPHGDGTRAIRRTLERLEQEADALRFSRRVVKRSQSRKAASARKAPQSRKGARR